MDRQMMPVPSPFGPPPASGGMPGMAAPMGMPPPRPQTSDPVALVNAIRALAPTVIKQPEPLYRPGYKPPKKKDPEEVVRTAKRLFDQHRLWRTLIYRTLQWTHQELTGMFPEDAKEREMGFQESYISTALSDERNLVIAKLMGHRPSFKALYTKDELRGDAQKLEDLYFWLRKEERHRAAIRGQRPLEIDEGALFVDYGMYVTRDTFAPQRTDCPVDMRLMDPCQVYPIWDDAYGLKEVYRVYSDTTAEITRAYGDFTDAQMKSLKDQIGNVTDDTEFEVIEYWDTWRRQVHVSGVLVMQADHKYGDVPYTIQYGGGGNPMFTRTPTVGAWALANNRLELATSTRIDERVHQATPYLYFRLRNHEIWEAIMGRVLTGFKKDINPPTIRYRSDAAAEKEMPQIDASPGAQNEAMMGEEKIEALPTTNMATTNALLTQLEKDRMTGSMPPEAFGRFDKSNISGVAQQGANDAGMHLISPLVRAYETGLGQRYDRIARMLGNFGHLSTHGGDRVQPLIVPVSRKRPNGATAFEFNREIMEKVGTRCEVSFSKVDPRDWPGLAAAGKNMVDGAFALRREIRELAIGDTDWESFMEEWMEENAIFGALQLPEFQKFAVLDQMLAQAKEHTSNPEVMRRYLRMAELWEQSVLAPQQQQMGQPGMPQGQPGMAPPQMATPGGPGGMSYPAVGAGPGSQGAPVGRPNVALQGSDVGP